MPRRYPLLVTATLLAACGKTDAPPTPTPVVAAPAPTPAPNVATPATPPTPDIGAPSIAAPTGSSYIVWTSGADGYQSTWLAPAAADTHDAAATRAQATVFAGGTLWGFEWPEVSFRQVSCEDMEEDRPGPPGPILKTSYLAVRGLAGAAAGEQSDVTRKRSSYFDDPDTRGVYSMVGEHWGRTIDLTGGAGDRILVTDCEGGYGCGAHGDSGCEFVVRGLAGGAVTMDLAGVATALAPATAGLIKEWRAGDEYDMDEPSIKAVSLLANDGEPLVDYLYVADVPYVATDGEWGSYTQSRSHVGPAVPALNLPETPAAVRAWLRGKGKDTRFGWSEVPADAPDTVLAAFRDPATVPPKRAPAAQPVAEPVAVDTTDKLKQGRALTRAKDYDQAIAVFSAAIEADASVARAWSGRGYARLLAGDLDGATTDFSHALGLDASPKFQAAVHFNLAETAEKRGDRAAALALYQKAQALAPSKAALQRIEALKAP